MDRGRLEAAAAEYTYLRGLLGIPAGLLAVVLALGNEAWGPFAHAGVVIACMALAGVAYLLLRRFYEDHYGRVALTSGQMNRAAVAAVVAVPIVFVGALLLRSRADWSLDLPVNPIPACFGAAMLVAYAVSVGVRIHHWVVYGALVVAGLLPFWRGADPSNIGLVMCGAAVIAAGILDHRLLVRSLGPSRGLRLEGGDAGA